MDLAKKLSNYSALGMDNRDELIAEGIIEKLSGIERYSGLRMIELNTTIFDSESGYFIYNGGRVLVKGGDEDSMIIQNPGDAPKYVKKTWFGFVEQLVPAPQNKFGTPVVEIRSNNVKQKSDIIIREDNPHLVKACKDLSELTNVGLDLVFA